MTEISLPQPTRGQFIRFFPVLPLIFGLLIFYMIPAATVSIAYRDRIAFDILVMTSGVILALVLSMIVILSAGSQLSARFTARRAITVAKLIVLMTFASYIALIVDFQGTPLTNYLTQGGNPAILRSEFTKEKEGIGQVAIYARSILLKALFGPALLILISSGRRGWFIISLATFSILSLASFERSIIVWAGIPLFAFFVLTRQLKSAILTIAWTLSILLIASTLQFTAGADLLSQNRTNLTSTSASLGQSGPSPSDVAPTIQLPLIASLQNETDFRFLLSRPSPDASATETVLRILVNRALWIPFVTVYDSILYWEIYYQSLPLGVGVNRHLASAFGRPFADLERSIFRFQFGSGIDSTGNANFAFYVEGYIGFGILGLITYSIIAGVIFGVIGAANSPIAAASSLAPTFSLLNASLISSLGSGGILLFIAFLVLVPIWRIHR